MPGAVALMAFFVALAGATEPTHKRSPAGDSMDKSNPTGPSTRHGNGQHLKTLGQVSEFSGESGKPMLQDPELLAPKKRDAPPLGRSSPSIPSKETGIPRALRGLLNTRYHNINLIGQTKETGTRTGVPGRWTFLNQRLQHLDMLGFAEEAQLQKKHRSHWFFDQATPSTHLRRAMTGVSNSAKALKNIGKRALVHLSSWPPQSPLASKGVRQQPPGNLRYKRQQDETRQQQSSV